MKGVVVGLWCLTGIGFAFCGLTPVARADCGSIPFYAPLLDGMQIVSAEKIEEREL